MESSAWDESRIREFFRWMLRVITFVAVAVETLALG